MRTLSILKTNAVARRSHGVLKERSGVNVRSPEPQSKVSYNATGAPRARITHTMVTVQTHCTFVALHGDCLALMRQSARLLVNPITLDNFVAIIDCMPGVRLYDGPDQTLFISVNWDRNSFICCRST